MFHLWGAQLWWQHVKVSTTRGHQRADNYKAKSIWTAKYYNHMCNIKPWTLICCYNCLHSSGKTFHKTVKPCCRDLLPLRDKNISEAHWCWTIRPDKFIPSAGRRWSQGSVRASEVLSHQTEENHFFMDLALCTGHCYVETGNGPHKLWRPIWLLSAH